MKRKAVKVLGLVVCMLIISSLSTAQEWITANQVTFKWTAVTTLKNGDPLPADSVVKYVVYTVPEKGSKDTDAVQVGTTAETSYTITFDTEGDFFLGVKAQRYVNDELKSESVISWSDNVAASGVGHAQGVTFWQPPADVGGEVIQGNAS